MQIVSLGDNLHEVSYTIFQVKYEKNVTKLSSAESVHSVVSVKPGLPVPNWVFLVFYIASDTRGYQD